jgi:4-amino-4-deoxy-L-arabinose transferase-like glycosyltransferase
VNRSTLPIGWILFATALVLRCAWVLVRWRSDGASLTFPDESLHWQLATHLVQDGTLTSDDGRLAARMPLYPLMLALFAAAGQAGILLARLAQALIGAVTAAVIYHLARASGGTRAAAVAGLLVAIDPFAIFFANLLLTETLFTLLLVSLVAAACQVLPPHSRRWSWGLVMITAPLALLTRPAVAALIPLVWGLILALSQDRRRALRPLLRCVAVLGVLLLPWGLRNRAVLGSFAWLSTNGGVTLYDAQGPQADGSSDQSFLEQIPALAGLDEVERDRLLQHRAWRQMREDPTRVLQLALTKIGRTWNPLPNVAEYRGGLAAWAGATYTIAVVLAALAGLILSARRRHAPTLRLHGFVFSAVLYFTLLHAVYIGSVRYRVPLMPLLAAAAATLCTQTKYPRTPHALSAAAPPATPPATPPPARRTARSESPPPRRDAAT